MFHIIKFQSLVLVTNLMTHTYEYIAFPSFSVLLCYPLFVLLRINFQADYLHINLGLRLFLVCLKLRQWLSFAHPLRLSLGIITSKYLFLASLPISLFLLMFLLIITYFNILFANYLQTSLRIVPISKLPFFSVPRHHFEY